MHNQRFMLLYINEYRRQHGKALDRDDLVQEAYIGLINAAEKYNPEKGRFITYAAIWMKQTLNNWLLKDGYVHLPANRRDELERIRKAMAMTHSYDPAILAKVANVDEDMVKTLLPYNLPVLSLDAPVTTPSGDEDVTFGDLYPVEVDFDTNLILEQILSGLPNDMYKDILISHFGVFGHEKMTLQAIADKYGLSKEYIRQLEGRALDMCLQYEKRIA